MNGTAQLCQSFGSNMQPCHMLLVLVHMSRSLVNNVNYLWCVNKHRARAAAVACACNAALCTTANIVKAVIPP